MIHIFCRNDRGWGCKKGLPERLFATDRYPSERVNMYSTVDHLLAARDALNSIPEMVKLIGSWFGNFFQILFRIECGGRAKVEHNSGVSLLFLCGCIGVQKLYRKCVRNKSCVHAYSETGVCMCASTCMWYCCFGFLEVACQINDGDLWEPRGKVECLD